VSKRNHVAVTWNGGHRFTGGRPAGPQIHVDADAVVGPGPVDTVLIALASCTSYDIVEILAKRRTPVESLDIDVKGDRADHVPAKLTRIELTYTIKGDGIDRSVAERAISLAINRYCSVRDSLDPAIPIEWKLELT
jgi:putative redox protein